MALTGIKGTFEALCQQYETWIIRYDAATFSHPLYMVWLTDTTDHETDKLVVSAENQVIAAASPHLLLEAIREPGVTLPDPVNTIAWMDKAGQEELFPSAVYAINKIKEALANRLFNQAALEEATNFINLSGDLAHQVGDNGLLELTNTDALRHLWDFYYDRIFWPCLHDKEAFERMEVPEFKPSYEALAADFNRLTRAFERRIALR